MRIQFKFCTYQFYVLFARCYVILRASSENTQAMLERHTSQYLNLVDLQILTKTYVKHAALFFWYSFLPN